IARQAGWRPVVFPVPFTVWHMLARIAELLPTPPLTRNQVGLMRIDTVASASPGFEVLGISPQPLEQVLQAILSRRFGRSQARPSTKAIRDPPKGWGMLVWQRAHKNGAEERPVDRAYEPIAESGQQRQKYGMGYGARLCRRSPWSSGDDPVTNEFLTI